MTGPAKIGDVLGQAPKVYTVPKRCPRCQTDRMGPAFSNEYTHANPALSLCDRCMDQAERTTTERTRRIAETELQRPRRAGE